MSEEIEFLKRRLKFLKEKRDHKSQELNIARISNEIEKIELKLKEKEKTVKNSFSYSKEISYLRARARLWDLQ